MPATHTNALTERLKTALEARQALLAQMEAEQTNAYRLFHGSVEGESGLTIDRYGDLLLIQTFHRPLTADELSEVESFYTNAFPGLATLYNDRSQSNSRISNKLTPEQNEVAMLPHVFLELGVKYRFQGRHAGQDPWLFLDMRAGRRRVMQEIASKSLLNLFAYTCGIGIAAAKAGARHVVNVDFSESSLAIGKENARLNELPIRVRLVKSDVFAALRQFSGLGQSQRVRGKVMPPFPKLEPHQFDVVFLDPPRYAKSPFGVVDLVNDYAALFKPALLSTAEGGTLICCNNVAEASRETWLDQIERSTRKAGRAIREFEWITPEADFPSTDGQPPLKILLLRV
jgi:23S rRNA (cytosine1962-C5)-methyltransferase